VSGADGADVLKSINKQQRTRLWRFAITGVGATLLHVSVASYLIEFKALWPAIANGCAFITATIFSYLINTFWSFSASANLKNATRFWVTSILGFCLSIGLSSLADGLGLHYMVGIAMVVAAVPLMSFVIHSTWTFKN